MRGIKKAQDKFIEEMSHKWVPHKMRANINDPKEPLQDFSVKIAMRPVVLYEMVFPEDMKDIVLNTLWPPEGEYTDGYFGNVWGKKFKWIIEKIRKLAGLKPIPEDFKRDKKLLCETKDVEFIGVGIKEDVKIHGMEML